MTEPKCTCRVATQGWMVHEVGCPVGPASSAKTATTPPVPLTVSEKFAVHRLIGHPWRTCGGRLGRAGKWENCPFVFAPNYQHAFAAVEVPFWLAPA